MFFITIELDLVVKYVSIGLYLLSQSSCGEYVKHQSIVISDGAPGVMVALLRQCGSLQLEHNLVSGCLWNAKAA